MGFGVIPEIDPEELKQLYQKHTRSWIAKHYGVGPTTIFRLLKKHGIVYEKNPTRGHLADKKTFSHSCSTKYQRAHKAWDPNFARWANKADRKAIKPKPPKRVDFEQLKERTFRVKELAALSGYHIESLARAIRSGKLKADRPPGRQQYLIKGEDYWAFLQGESPAGMNKG